MNQQNASSVGMKHQRRAGDVARTELMAREGRWCMFEQCQDQLAAFFFLGRCGETGREAESFVGGRHPRLEFDRGQHFRRALVEGPANGQQALDARQVRTPLDGTDLRDAEFGGGGKVFERPVALDAQHLDLMA